MRHGAVKTSPREWKNGGGRGSGRDSRGKQPAEQCAAARQQLKQCPAITEYYSEWSSAAYTLIHTHHYNLAKGPKSPTLSKEGDEGAFQSNAHTSTRGQVDAETLPSTHNNSSHTLTLLMELFCQWMGCTSAIHTTVQRETQLESEAALNTCQRWRYIYIYTCRQMRQWRTSCRTKDTVGRSRTTAGDGMTFTEQGAPWYEPDSADATYISNTLSRLFP